MDQKSIESHFNEINIGKILYLGSTTSTNEIASQWVKEGVPNYSLIVADEQTKGRGRAGRTWRTYPGTSLAFSLILYPTKSANLISRYSGLGALAVWTEFNDLGIRNVKIKWPNDVLIQGKKACGILSEAIWHGNELKAIILGIGINITKDSIPPVDELNFPATYVNLHTETPAHRLSLLRNLIISIRQWESLIGTDEIIAAWNHKMAFRGKEVKVFITKPEKPVQKKPPTEIKGILQGVNNDGEILLQLADGKIESYNANEIQIVSQH